MTNPPAGIEQEWVEAVARAICISRGRNPDRLNDGIHGLEQWRDVAPDVEIAIRVLAPLITARERERCAADSDIIADRHYANGMRAVLTALWPLSTNASDELVATLKRLDGESDRRSQAAMAARAESIRTPR